MPDSKAVKKDAQKYESQCEVSTGMRKTVGVFAMLAAILGALCAFLDQHRYDRWCSAVVVVLIVWEAAGYGVRHWEEHSPLTLGYRTLADAIARGGRTDEKAESELSAIGAPPVGAFSRTIGALANRVQWRGKRGAALILQQIFGFVLVCFAVAAAVIVAEIVRPEKTSLTGEAVRF